MKPNSPAIAAFIEDFHLMKPNGVVSFIATVELKTSRTISSIKSEIFILSVEPKGLDTINFLNPAIDEMDFPVMFQSGREVFSYIDGVCLMIIGNNAANGDYVISIYPADMNEAISLN